MWTGTIISHERVNKECAVPKIKLFAIIFRSGCTYRYVSNAGSIPPANVQMAAATVMLLPCVVLFFCFQKMLINGVTVGAVKG